MYDYLLSLRLKPRLGPGQRGASLLGALVVVVVVGIAIGIGAQRFKTKLDHAFVTIDRGEARELAEFYLRILRNPETARQTRLSDTALNTRLSKISPKNSSYTAIARAPLAVVDAAGAEVIPLAGLILDADLVPTANLDDGRWLIKAYWRGVNDVRNVLYVVEVAPLRGGHAGKIVRVELPAKLCLTVMEPMPIVPDYFPWHDCDHCLRKATVFCPVDYRATQPYLVGHPANPATIVKVLATDDRAVTCGEWRPEVLLVARINPSSTLGAAGADALINLDKSVTGDTLQEKLGVGEPISRFQCYADCCYKY